MFSKMVDMRRSPDVEKEAAPEPVAMDAPAYPYGLSICLGNEELEKLDLDPSCEVGDTIDLRAFAKVTSVSMNDYGGKPQHRIELQITQLAVENEDDEAPDDKSAEGAPVKRERYK
jgi:hypothetical protein